MFRDSSVVVDSWLPCKDPAKLKGKEKGLDHLPAFAKVSNNQIWPCIVEKVRARADGWLSRSSRIRQNTAMLSEECPKLFLLGRRYR